MLSSSNSTTGTLKAPVPPPVLFFMLLIAGVAAAHFYPLDFLPERLVFRLAFGLPLFGLSLVIGVSAFAALRRCNTSAQFGEPVSSLVQRGPYRVSRNPLYLALLTVLLGFAFVLNNGWLLIGSAILLLLLDRLVVRREEVFLSTLFGAAYVSYRENVRRWL
jgi:protein-S-isoprenylcysteine O-methyltransferase Ste14